MVLARLNSLGNKSTTSILVTSLVWDTRSEHLLNALLESIDLLEVAHDDGQHLHLLEFFSNHS